MGFKQHGSSDVWKKNKILFAKLVGSWNKEAAIDYSNKFKDEAQSLIREPWAHIVYLDDWELCEPSMFEVIQDLVQWSLDNGLTRAANVHKPSGVKKEFINKMVLEQTSTFKRAVFSNEQDALTWLKQEGFSF